MTAQTTTLLGIDWGTSNRRSYVLDAGGELVRQHDDDAGILNVNGDFAGSLRALLQTLGIEQADIVMSGMVGSRNGWREAPYLTTDRPLIALHDNLMPIDTGIPGVRCRVAPGYRYIDPYGIPDVMRGEEAQILGALALGGDAANDAGGWFLLPGTHSKWARVEQGCIMEFLTFMTGEFFALLSQYGTLSKVIGNKDESYPDAFAAGVRAAKHGSFPHTAFGCRALVVTDMMPAEHTASYLSGLLIGTEIHDILQRTTTAPGTPVQVVGSPGLSARYHSALELLGIPSRAWQPDQVYLAALKALFNLPR